MREALQGRLELLRAELQTGQSELQKVEAQREYLRETILRIGGAVQVLEELLAEEQPDGRGTTDPNNTEAQQVPAQGK